MIVFEHVEHEPTFLTNDADFASLEPSEHGVPKISVEHVRVDDG